MNEHGGKCARGVDGPFALFALALFAPVLALIGHVVVAMIGRGSGRSCCRWR